MTRIIVLFAALALLFVPASSAQKTSGKTHDTNQFESGGGGGPLSTGACTYWNQGLRSYGPGSNGGQWEWWCLSDGYIWFKSSDGVWQQAWD